MKEKVQLFGRALSGMVMPNIGAFIAWGLITALFISTGWCPNETLAQLVDPMSKYLLPLLIGYTGGKVVGDHRGGRIGHPDVYRCNDHGTTVRMDFKEIRQAGRRKDQSRL